MRILQLIDSLEVGGAERMAVNYANALAEKIDFSSIVVTRKEGDLEQQLSNRVNYFFLNKKSVFDVKAILKLKSYIKKNRIDWIHAHSTSFFLAVLVKFFYPRVKIIWHDHYGNSEFLENRKYFVLKLSSFYFNGIISVNEKLKSWSKTNLFCEKVIYFPNFTLQEKNIQINTVLKGIDNKRIICLANLRQQKNHFLLLEIAELLKNSHPEWTFHLVGKDFNDDYSAMLKKAIVEKKLSNYVYCYGSKNDIVPILHQSNIGILTSSSEGLPVALLEYGFNKLPVVTSAVGEISSIINGENGILVTQLNAKQFHIGLIKLIDNLEMRNKFAKNLFEFISENFSSSSIIVNYLKWLN